MDLSLVFAPVQHKSVFVYDDLTIWPQDSIWWEKNHLDHHNPHFINRILFTLKTLYSSCYHALCCFIHKLTGDTISNNFVSFCKANLQYTTQYSQLMCENYCVSGSYLFSFVLGSTLPQMVWAVFTFNVTVLKIFTTQKKLEI